MEFFIQAITFMWRTGKNCKISKENWPPTKFTKLYHGYPHDSSVKSYVHIKENIQPYSENKDSVYDCLLSKELQHVQKIVLILLFSKQNVFVVIPFEKND